MHICMWHGKSNIDILQDLVLRKREAWALEKGGLISQRRGAKVAIAYNLLAQLVVTYSP